jgi:hypothetical protein
LDLIHTALRGQHACLQSRRALELSEAIQQVLRLQGLLVVVVEKLLGRLNLRSGFREVLEETVDFWVVCAVLLRYLEFVLQ